MVFVSSSSFISLKRESWSCVLGGEIAQLFPPKQPLGSRLQAKHCTTDHSFRLRSPASLELILYKSSPLNVWRVPRHDLHSATVHIFGLPREVGLLPITEFICIRKVRFELPYFVK